MCPDTAIASNLGAAPFTRDAFVYRRADGTQADLFRMAPIVGMADVGIGVVIR